MCAPRAAIYPGSCLKSERDPVKILLFVNNSFGVGVLYTSPC